MIYPAHFFSAMSSFLRYASACCLFLMLAGGAMLKAAPPGFVEGQLKILSLKEVELAEEGLSKGATEAYERYPLVVLSQDGHRAIAHVTADSNGHYRATLPPGEYILDVQNPAPKHYLRTTPQSFKIESNQTVRVDMTVDPGIR